MSKIPFADRKSLSDDEFFNRTREISDLRKLLQSTSENNAPDILVTGIRGVGKTVLLNKIKEFFNKDYLVVYMDFSQSHLYRKNFSLNALFDFYYQRLISEANSKGLNTFNSEIEKFFKTNNFKLTTMGVVTAYDIPIPIPIIKTERDLNKYKDFVFKLPQEIYNQNKDKIKGIIIIIDEFQIIKKLDDYLESFLWNYRAYITDQRNVAYIFSGSMSLQDKLISEIAGHGGAFGGRMLTIHINPFSFETTKNYIKYIAPDLNFTEDGFKRFYQNTEGIPSYINSFARFLPNNYELNENFIDNSFNENLRFIINQIVSIWGRLTTKEKDIVIALIDSPLKRIELAERFEVKSGSLSYKLKKLKNLGFIIFKNNKYEINEKLLRRWLVVEYEKNGFYPDYF